MGKVSRLLEEQLMSMYILVVNSVNRMAFGKIPQFVANTFVFSNMSEQPVLSNLKGFF